MRNYYAEIECEVCGQLETVERGEDGYVMERCEDHVSWVEHGELWLDERTDKLYRADSLVCVSEDEEDEETEVAGA